MASGVHAVRGVLAMLFFLGCLLELHCFRQFAHQLFRFDVCVWLGVSFRRCHSERLCSPLGFLRHPSKLRQQHNLSKVTNKQLFRVSSGFLASALFT